MSSDVEGISRSGTIIAVAITVVTLSFFTILLRLVSRIVLLRRAALDDFFIVVAWVAAFLDLSPQLPNHPQLIALPCPL